MQTRADATASAGRYLTVAPDNDSKGSPPATGHATIPFSVPVSGSYKVWGRVIAPTDDDDSFWVRVDGGRWIKWNEIPLGSTWHWAPVHDSDAGDGVVVFSLSAGSHTLTVAYREDGTRIDRLLITNQASFTPSGTGP
jgi:hypothetical protein